MTAGAGGQSLGLEQAGFAHAAAVELDPDACAPLRLNLLRVNLLRLNLLRLNLLRVNLLRAV